MDLKELAQDFKRKRVRIEVEWIAERDSDPVNEKHGKEILERLLQHVLDLRTELAMELGDRQYRVVGTVDDILRKLKAIQRYEVTYGPSFQEFWEQGDSIINLLRDVPHDIREISG